MTNRMRFENCRKRLWNLLDNIDMDCGHKSYEGAIEINMKYPNYFEGYSDVPKSFTITLHFYVLGDTRHTDFRGKTFKEALDKFEHWIEVEEATMDEVVEG